MATVNFNDLDLAFEFVSSGGVINARAVVSRENGKIYWDSTELDDELDVPPGDIDDLDKYAEVPSKYDLELGQVLVFRFVDSELPERHEDVRAIFSRRGAYGRFKGLLEREGKLEKWYQFEAEAQKKSLSDWAESEGFTVIFPNDVPRNV